MLELLYAMSEMGYGKHPAMDELWDRLEGRRDDNGRYPVDWYPPQPLHARPQGKGEQVGHALCVSLHQAKGK